MSIRILKNFFSIILAKTLFEIYFQKYNQKIWKRDLSEIPMDWLDGKLPMINPEEILIKNIISSKSDNMVHSTFYYPIDGGSQFIAEKLSKDLNIIYKKIEKIKKIDNKLFINNLKRPFDKIIYTGDVRKLAYILDKEIYKSLSLGNILEEIKDLNSNGTSTLLCECEKNDYSWIYLPENDIKSHRMIMTGNFSPKNNSPNLNNERITCTIECSGKVSKQDMINELNYLPFSPKPLAYNYCPNSYIIQNKKTREIINELRIKLKKVDIYLCGRFAEWEYYNMDAAIESAFRIKQSMEF